MDNEGYRLVDALSNSDNQYFSKKTIENTPKWSVNKRKIDCMIGQQILCLLISNVCFCCYLLYWFSLDYVSTLQST